MIDDQAEGRFFQIKICRGIFTIQKQTGLEFPNHGLHPSLSADFDLGCSIKISG
jgi:hypothetical protein